jgi:rubredoxin
LRRRKSRDEQGGNEMKKLWVLLAVVSLLIPISVNAQSTLALQEKCAEGAKKFFSDFKDQYRSDSNLWPEGTCHYNKKLDRCFIQISVFNISSNGVREKLSQYLFDVFEGIDQSNISAYGKFQNFPDRTKTPYCTVGNKICHSEAEFIALIKPYMEE